MSWLEFFLRVSGVILIIIALVIVCLWPGDDDDIDRGGFGGFQ